MVNFSIWIPVKWTIKLELLSLSPHLLSLFYFAKSSSIQPCVWALIQSSSQSCPVFCLPASEAEQRRRIRESVRICACQKSFKELIERIGVMAERRSRRRNMRGRIGNENGSSSMLLGFTFFVWSMAVYSLSIYLSRGKVVGWICKSFILPCNSYTTISMNTPFPD